MNDEFKVILDLIIPAIFVFLGCIYLVKSYKIIVDNEIIYRMLKFLSSSKK